MSKIVELEKQLMQKNKELDSLRVRAKRHFLKPTPNKLTMDCFIIQKIYPAMADFYIRIVITIKSNVCECSELGKSLLF